MKYVVDASVAAKWLVEETGSSEARSVLSSGATLLAPELIVAEISNVAWKKLGRQEISSEHALAMIRLLPRLLDGLASLAPLAEAALTIGRDLDHPIYNAFYLALAEREGRSWSATTSAYSPGSWAPPGAIEFAPYPPFPSSPVAHRTQPTARPPRQHYQELTPRLVTRCRELDEPFATASRPPSRARRSRVPQAWQ